MGRPRPRRSNSHELLARIDLAQRRAVGLGRHAAALRAIGQHTGNPRRLALASWAHGAAALLGGELAVAQNPQLFSFHHGDYEHIIENYRRPRGSAENLLFVSYYAYHPDHTAARAAASLYVEWAHRDPAFRDEFLLHEVRVRTNLAFVEQRI